MNPGKNIEFKAVQQNLGFGSRKQSQDRTDEIAKMNVELGKSKTEVNACYY